MAGVIQNQFEECTPIQEAAIPVIRQGRDVAGLAQTGTGKTAAFLIPLMDRILLTQEKMAETGNSSSKSSSVENKEENKTEDQSQEIKPPTKPYSEWRASHYVLVLVPTRELAMQVFDNVRSLGSEAHMKAVAVYGGTSYDPQKKAISRGVQFVVATPGRLIDLYKEKVVDLNQVRAVVFDEADRMFDMGFKDDMRYILRRIPRDRQFLVFSATLNFDVLNVAYEFGADPTEVNIDRDKPKAENVEDQVFHVGQGEKPKWLLSLLRKHEPRQAIIFSNFKNNVERIAQFLTSNGIPAVGISSLLTQAQRRRVMDQFKGENDRNILVATDVAARGLDIEGVDLVVNFDMSDDPENYIHRIGRTGRAGSKGQAFSLVSDRDVEAFQRLEEFLNHKITIGWMEDGDLVEDFQAFPAEVPQESRRPRQRTNRSSQGSRRGRSDDRRKGHSPSKGGGSRRGTGGGERQRSAESGPETHRDRRTGRHDQKGSGRSQESRSSQNRSRNGRREDSKNRSPQKRRGPRKEAHSGGRQGRPAQRNQRVSSRTTRPAPTPPTLGQRVAGFFKKLFE